MAEGKAAIRVATRDKEVVRVVARGKEAAQGREGGRIRVAARDLVDREGTHR